MPPTQVAQMRGGVADRPPHCADDWGRDEHTLNNHTRARRHARMAGINLAEVHGHTAWRTHEGTALGKNATIGAMVDKLSRGSRSPFIIVQHQDKPTPSSPPAGWVEAIKEFAAAIADAETEAPPWKTPSSPPAGWVEAIKDLVAATADAETEVPSWKKRGLTCLLAMHMPAEGVDENLESAMDCWNFYVDQPPAPTIPTVPPSTEIVEVVGVHTSPGMTFEG